MFTGSIKISELDALSLVVGADFFPLVQSGSLTTYRVDIITLNSWFRVSGSVVSISSVRTVSASWASSSINSVQTVSASWASSSISSSTSITAISASYAPFTQAFQPSASWASQSLSASYSISASYSPVLGDSLPVGAIMGFGATTAPSNWLECDGAAYLTASFSELYAAISSSNLTASFGYLCDGFGNRNSSGYYFKMPDFRGEFLRGWDNNRGIDSSRVFSSRQNGSVQQHKHLYPLSNADTIGLFGEGGSGIYPGTDNHGNDGKLWFTNDGTTYSGASPNTTGVVTSETRPRNVAIMWCIKYSNAITFANASTVLNGDVIGTSAATSVVAIRNSPVSATPPTDGQVFAYNATSSQWEPQSNITRGLAKAFVMFTGNSSVAISSSYNVSSVARIASGRYTISFTSPMTSTNYLVIGNGLQSSPTAGNAIVSEYWNASSGPYQKTVNEVCVCCLDPDAAGQTFTDGKIINVVIFE